MDTDLDAKKEYCNTLQKGQSVQFIDNSRKYAGTFVRKEKDLGIVVTSWAHNTRMFGVLYKDVILPTVTPPEYYGPEF
jgi:hypothetical protein